MPHTAEAPAGRTNVRFQHGLDPFAQRQVGKSNDAGSNLGRSITAAVTHGSCAGDKLRLADRTEFLRTAGPVHRMALQEHGGGDVVAPAEVVEQVSQQVSMIGALPKMMVTAPCPVLGYGRSGKGKGAL